MRRQYQLIAIKIDFYDTMLVHLKKQKIAM